MVIKLNILENSDQQFIEEACKHHYKSKKCNSKQIKNYSKWYYGK